jgi:hypothetical protein
MKPLFLLAAQVQEFILSHGWKYSFIGGIALQRWGQPRLTNDIDITVITGFGNELAYIDILLSAFSGRLPEAREFALENRVLLLQSSGGIPIDIALGGIPLEEEIVRRSSRYQYLPNVSLLTCSAEDLIVLKAFADRTRDWADIETVLKRQKNKLDWPYIETQLEPLSVIKENESIMTRLIELKGRFS